jgi:hypothetical protein
MSKTKPSKSAKNANRKTAAQPAVIKRSPKKPTTASAPKTGSNRKPGKIDQVIAMIRRPKGASISDLTKATAWQAHSVRGAISGTLRKKQGLNIVSEKSGDVRLYRIADKAVG